MSSISFVLLLPVILKQRIKFDERCPSMLDYRPQRRCSKTSRLKMWTRVLSRVSLLSHDPTMPGLKDPTMPGLKEFATFITPLPALSGSGMIHH